MGKKPIPGSDTEKRTIQLSLIDRDPRQPRRIFTEDSIKNLAQSIKNTGLLQRVLVKIHPEHPGRYMLIAGERRFRAMQSLKIEEAVFDFWLGDPNTFALSLVENLHREDLTPIEEGRAYKRLQDEDKMTLQKISDHTGRSVPTIHAKLKLLTLPERIQNMIEEGTLPQISALNVLKTGASEKRLIRMAYDLIAGRVPAEISNPDFDEEELRQRWERMRTPNDPEGIMKVILQNNYSLSTSARAIEAFLALPKKTQILVWESLTPRAQESLRVNFETMATQAGQFLKTIQTYYDLSQGTPEEQQRAKKIRAFATTANILRRLLYNDIRIRVNLGKRYIHGTALRGGYKEEQVASILARTFQVLEENWYHTREDCDDTSRIFVNFVLNVRKDFRTTNQMTFDQFLDMLYEQDISLDPLDVREIRRAAAA